MNLHVVEEVEMATEDELNVRHSRSFSMADKYILPVTGFFW
jgi:hypothetical protein